MSNSPQYYNLSEYGAASMELNMHGQLGYKVQLLYSYVGFFKWCHFMSLLSFGIGISRKLMKHHLAGFYRVGNLCEFQSIPLLFDLTSLHYCSNNLLFQSIEINCQMLNISGMTTIPLYWILS